MAGNAVILPNRVRDFVLSARHVRGGGRGFPMFLAESKRRAEDMARTGHEFHGIQGRYAGACSLQAEAPMLVADLQEARFTLSVDPTASDRALAA